MEGNGISNHQKGGLGNWGDPVAVFKLTEEDVLQLFCTKSLWNAYLKHLAILLLFMTNNNSYQVLLVVDYLLTSINHHLVGLKKDKISVVKLQPKSLVKRQGVEFVFTPSQSQSQPHQKRNFYLVVPHPMKSLPTQALVTQKAFLLL